MHSSSYHLGKQSLIPLGNFWGPLYNIHHAIKEEGAGPFIYQLPLDEDFREKGRHYSSDTASLSSGLQRLQWADKACRGKNMQMLEVGSQASEH